MGAMSSKTTPVGDMMTPSDRSTRRNEGHMARIAKSVPDKKLKGKQLSSKKLDHLIEEAIVDCYNDSEQAMGLYTMIEEHLVLPFKTQVLGVEVVVEGI